jgi:hypothetical protein
VSDAADERITVEWSNDYRACTAHALDPVTRAALVLRFHSPEPVLDPIARLRMEQVALDAVARIVAL